MQEDVKSGAMHPMQLKKDMAQEIVARFWSVDGAAQARAQFESLFQKHDYSRATAMSLPDNFANPVWIVELLKALGAIGTSSEAKRLIDTGSVHLDDAIVTDFKAMVEWKSGMIVKVGKHRIYKIK